MLGLSLLTNRKALHILTELIASVIVLAWGDIDIGLLSKRAWSARRRSHVDGGSRLRLDHCLSALGAVGARAH